MVIDDNVDEKNFSLFLNSNENLYVRSKVRKNIVIIIYFHAKHYLYYIHMYIYMHIIHLPIIKYETINFSMKALRNHKCLELPKRLNYVISIEKNCIDKK